MEEVVVEDGLIKNPSFTDYLIPTLLDMPPMQIDVLENPDPHAPYGLRGVGEPPTISSGPAILAAVRNATGLELNRVPLRPDTSPASDTVSGVTSVDERAALASKREPRVGQVSASRQTDQP